MHDVLVAIAIGTGAFFGTMIDNFFAFTAQLALTDAKRFRRVSYAHIIGVMVLIIASAAVGSALNFIPLGWAGLLAIAPLALAAHAWRNQSSDLAPQRRGATTTFLVTVGLGGDNIAVWIPILRSQGVLRGVTVALTILIFDIALVFWPASYFATHSSPSGDSAGAPRLRRLSIWRFLYSLSGSVAGFPS